MTFICGAKDAAPDDALRVLSGLTSCCYQAAEDGPAACVCWTVDYDLDQAEPRPEAPGTRSKMCEDCAYRPDSPERSGDERYQEHLGDEWAPFWCHTGMRKAARYHHPLGIVVECTGDFYRPPILVQDGVPVPFKADGTPGDRCAGWAAQQRLNADVVTELAESATEAR